MALHVESVSLIRENVTADKFGNHLLALEMPGVRSVSLLMVARAKNDAAPIWDAPAGGESTVIIEDSGGWED